VQIVPRRWSFSFAAGRSTQSAADKSNETTIAARLLEAEIVAASKLRGDARKQAMAGVWSRLPENRSGFDAGTIEILEAEIAMADNNLALARLHAKSAAELAPNSAPAHYVVGVVAACSGDNDTAELEWQNALDQDGHFGPARLALAEAALARGDGDNADEQARIVVRDNPGDLQGILVFARALLLEGKVLPAAIMAQRASSLDPVSPEPGLILGEVALKTGHAAQALMQFERALALHPDSDEAIDGMLHVYQSGRMSYAAIKKMERVAQQPPVSSTLLEIAGRLYAARGWYSDAIRTLRTCTAIDPQRVTAARALARLQAATGDLAGATNSAAKAGIDAQPLLNAYREQNSGDWKKAVAIYERALSEGDQSGVAANNVAWLYAEHGSQLDRALSLAETAAHASPNDPAVLDTLGFVHLRRREYSDAVKLLQAAARISEELGLAPERTELNQQIRKHLGEAYMCSGQTAEAMKLAQKRDPLPAR
jgi:tetratricopeptide (TPR) repeat protein